MKFKRAGFTITELLVVIVVIGILAAITVVSYSGITQKAKDSSLQSDLANASSQLELYKIEYGSYPSVLDANNCPVLPVADTKYCLKLSPGNAISYSYLEPSQSNFITINNGSNVKSKSSDGSIASGYDLNYGLALSLDAGNSTSYPEPKTGPEWTNIIDNNDKFTLLNGPIYSNNNGGYFSFDGVDDRAAGSKYPVYGNNMTWLAWVNCSQNMPNTLNMFMGRFLPYFSFSNCNSVLFSNSIGGNQRSLYSKLSNLSLNTWYCFAFTTKYDGANTTMSIYINGNLDNSGSFAGTQSNSSNYFAVGDGRKTPAWYPFNGKVSDVKVYNRNLSPAEIQKYFSDTKSRYGL